MIGAARSSDPGTSHAAAQSVNATELEHQVRVVLQSRGPYGGTCYEVMGVLGLSHQTVSPRFALLRRKGLIVKTDRRRPGSSGRGQIVWVAA